MSRLSRLAPQELVVGIFVGGASRRMGRAKGLLPAPDGSGRTLVGRLKREVMSALPDHPIVLVGERDVYAVEELPMLVDAASDCGPLGGLVSLLAHGQSEGASAILALACDLPFLESSLIRRVASEEGDVEVFCPFLDERYQPLVARYSVSLLPRFREALDRRELALQPLLRGVNTETVDLSSEEERVLGDWDTPEDAGLTDGDV